MLFPWDALNVAISRIINGESLFLASLTQCLKVWLGGRILFSWDDLMWLLAGLEMENIFVLNKQDSVFDGLSWLQDAIPLG